MNCMREVNGIGFKWRWETLIKHRYLSHFAFKWPLQWFWVLVFEFSLLCRLLLRYINWKIASLMCFLRCPDSLCSWWDCMLSVVIGGGFVIAHVCVSFSPTFAAKRLPEYIIHLLQFVLQSLLDMMVAVHASNHLIVEQHLLTGSCLFVLKSSHIFHQLFLNWSTVVFRENWLLSIFSDHK